MDPTILHLPKPYATYISPFLTISSAGAGISTLIVTEATLHNINISHFHPRSPNPSLLTYVQITVILMPAFFTNGADLIGFVKGSTPEFPFCTPCTVECRRAVRKAQARASFAAPWTVSTVFVKGVC